MGLDNIGGWEIIVLILLGLFIFGPDKLPKAIQDGVRMLRQLREMARNATGDLSRELGTNIELEDLHPKRFIRKHLLSEEDEAALRKPLDDLYGELRGNAQSIGGDLRSTADALNAKPSNGAPSADVVRSNGARRHVYDTDAT